MTVTFFSYTYIVGFIIYTCITNTYVRAAIISLCCFGLVDSFAFYLTDVSFTWPWKFVEKFGDCRWDLFVFSPRICHENDRQIQREVCIGKKGRIGK